MNISADDSFRKEKHLSCYKMYPDGSYEFMCDIENQFTIYQCESYDGGREVDVLKTVLPRGVHFHAKDLDAKGNCVALGSGTVNVAGCMKALQEFGYTGAVSLETEGGMMFEDSIVLAEESKKYLDAILN